MCCCNQDGRVAARMGSNKKELLGLSKSMNVAETWVWLASFPTGQCAQFDLMGGLPPKEVQLEKLNGT